MRTLLALILLFMMFGWLGILFAGLGIVAALAWIMNNIGLVILFIVLFAVGKWHRFAPRKDILNLREDEIVK
jgi:hypothetical protein